MTDIEFDLSLTGLSLAEIDLTLDHARESSASTTDVSADQIPALPTNPVSRTGDIWLLGRHRLLCGDARSRGDVQSLMGTEKPDLIFTDPPYNVPIDGHVGG